MKLKDQPQVGKTLQPPQGVRIAVRRLKHDGSPELGHQAALPGYAEFFRQLCADAGDDIHGHPHFLRPVSVRWARMSLGKRSSRTASPATMITMHTTTK